MNQAPGGEANGLPDPAPIEASLALEGAGNCIAEARHLAAAFLTRARTEHLLTVSTRAVELTQLVVSELVTNARKYAPGPILLRLRILAAVVEVAVWDSHPHLPVARAADPGRIGQHGLEIVMAIAQEVDIRSEPVGKRITARIPLLDDPRPGDPAPHTA